MKLVRYAVDGGPPADGQLDGDRVVPLGTAGPSLPLGDVRLLAPVDPGKIICVGLNYRDHAAEAGLPLPAGPLLFAKHVTALVGPDAEIRLPAETRQVDWEAELAVVIGADARDVPPDRALEHVLGYTCLNDVSARDVQAAESQWVRAKSFDTFCPVGPWVVTADEVPDPGSLRIACRVGGEEVQQSSTAEMVFDVAAVVAFASRGTTLHRGDVIATGTPAGVGAAHRPPRFLRDGDVVEVEIESVGVLRNPVVGL